MKLKDLGKITILPHTEAYKRFNKDPELSAAVMAGERAIAVTVNRQIKGYIASPNLLETWNIQPRILPYGQLFLSHIGTLWSDMENSVFSFGESFPIAIDSELFKGER